MHGISSAFDPVFKTVKRLDIIPAMPHSHDLPYIPNTNKTIGTLISELTPFEWTGIASSLTMVLSLIGGITVYVIRRKRQVREDSKSRRPYVMSQYVYPNNTIPIYKPTTAASAPPQFQFI